MVTPFASDSIHPTTIASYGNDLHIKVSGMQVVSFVPFLYAGCAECVPSSCSECSTFFFFFSSWKAFTVPTVLQVQCNLDLPRCLWASFILPFQPPSVATEQPSITFPGQLQSACWSLHCSLIQTLLCRDTVHFHKSTPTVYKSISNRSILSKGPQCAYSSHQLCSCLSFLETML